MGQRKALFYQKIFNWELYGILINFLSIKDFINNAKNDQNDTLSKIFILLPYKFAYQENIFANKQLNSQISTMQNEH